MRKIRYFQYTSNIYQNQAEYPVYIDLGSSDKTKQYYIVKSPDSKVKFWQLRNGWLEIITFFKGRNSLPKIITFYNYVMVWLKWRDWKSFIGDR